MKFHSLYLPTEGYKNVHTFIPQTDGTVVIWLYIEDGGINKIDDIVQLEDAIELNNYMKKLGWSEDPKEELVAKLAAYEAEAAAAWTEAYGSEGEPTAPTYEDDQDPWTVQLDEYDCARCRYRAG